MTPSHLYAPAQRATNDSIRAGIAALESPTGAETGAFTAAHKVLLSLGLGLDAALVAIDAGMVLGPTPEVRPLLDHARTFFDERDATALLARLDSIEAGERAGPPPDAAADLSPMADRAARPA